MFKVGDKVRAQGGSLKGNIYTIKTIGPSFITVKEDIGLRFSSDVIELVEKPRKPVRGEMVQVRGCLNHLVSLKRQERMYMGAIKQAYYPYSTVLPGSEKEFNDGKLVDKQSWAEMRQKPIQEPVDMKLSEVIEKLGYNIKIVKE